MALGGEGVHYRCDRTRSVKEPELCVPTVETLNLESVSHLRFQFVIQWKGKFDQDSGLGLEREGRRGLSYRLCIHFYGLFVRANKVISTIFTT